MFLVTLQAFYFGVGYPLKVKVKSPSRVQLFATPWAVAHQAPLSLEFSKQEYCSELLFPFPGDLPDPGIEAGSPTEPAGQHKPWIMGTKYLITDK